MSPLLELYLEKLRCLHDQQVHLVSALQPVVTLKPADKFGYSFSPIESSISEQIRHWPEDIPLLLPLPLWVKPRKGKVELEDGKWEFAFHGAQGLSFFHNRTKREVSIEYSTQGDIGITNWATRIFLEGLNSNEPYFWNLLDQHNRLFNELVRLGYLVKIPPKISFVEDVFVLQVV